MEVKLVLVKPDGQRKEFDVRHPASTIGRGPECTFRIPVSDVSRKHCELALGEGELRVRDLASSNGTFVNDRRINETTLSAGDRLGVGPVVMTIQIDGQPAEIAPVGAAEPAADEELVAAAPAEAPAAEEADDEVIELEPDEVADLPEVGGEESDPIAALEALAEQSKNENEEDK